MTRVRTQRGKPGQNEHRTYEASDIAPGAASLTIGAVAAIVIVVALGVAGLLWHFGTLHQPPSKRSLAPAGARLEANERADRSAIEANARAVLAGSRGGIPIGQAMQETAAAGWDKPS